MRLDPIADDREEPPAKKKRRNVGIFNTARFSEPMFKDVPPEILEKVSGVLSRFDRPLQLMGEQLALGESRHRITGEEPRTET